MSSYELHILKLKEEPRRGDLTNRGQYYQSEYLTPLSYYERQFHVYFCEYGDNDRIKPIKINVVLKKGDAIIDLSKELQFHLFSKYMSGKKEFIENIDFVKYYGINWVKKRWECIGLKLK